MTDIFGINGRKNQTQLKNEIRRLWGQRQGDNDIKLIISRNAGMRTFIKTINVSGFFEKVTTLELIDCAVKDISGIKKFTNLKKIVVKGCHEMSLEPLPTELNKLETIYADGNNFKIDDFSLFPNLINLTLKWSTPRTLTNIDSTNLKYLYLEAVSESFPDFPLERLTSLKTLTMYQRTPIQPGLLPPSQRFDSKIKNLPNLEELHINFQLSNLVVGVFPKLKKLKMKNCVFFENVDIITNLESLTLEKIKTASRHDTIHDKILVPIGRCVNLKELIFINNREMRDRLDDLQNIKIPDSIGNLIHLETLDLSNNKIEEIPPTIGNLLGLKDLFLGGNLLEELPSSITNLRSLENIELLGNIELERNLRDMEPGIDINSLDSLQYFSSSCLKKTLLVKTLNSCSNVSSTLIDLKINSIHRGTFKPISISSLRMFDIELYDRQVLPYIEQFRNYMEEKGRDLVGANFSIRYKDVLLFGIFKVFMPGEAGIDAGGLYRQTVSNISDSIEKDYLKNFKVESREGQEIIETDMSESDLIFTLNMLALLFNTGEGNFESIFTFGHCINIWNGIYPDRNIMEHKVYNDKTLEDIVKDFAINYLEEPSVPVKALSWDNPRTELDLKRLLTYLWLMSEFITSKNNMEEGSMCLLVKTYNNTGMNRGGYDYVFIGAEMEREHPTFEEDFSYLNDTVGANVPAGNNAPRNIPQFPLPPGVNNSVFQRNVEPQNLRNRLNRLRRRRNNEPLVDRINRLAGNNNGPDGVDLEELLQRLQGSGIQTPEVQPLLDDIQEQIENPVDPEDLERRVNEILRNQGNVRLGSNLSQQYANLTYDQLISNIQIDRESLDEMSRNIPLSDEMLRNFNEIKEAETHYIRRRDAGFPIGVDIDILQYELDDLRLAIETVDRLVLENEQANAAAANQGNAPANQGNAPGPSWRDVPTGQVLRVLENAIVRPIDEQDLQDITDAATDAANDGYDPLQYHERHGNDAMITLLGRVPSYIPRFMDIYFGILGRDIRNETIISWLENADSSIRNGFLIMLHGEIETLNANPRNNAANAQGNNAANAQGNNAAAPVSPQRTRTPSPAAAPASPQRARTPPPATPPQQSVRNQIAQSRRGTVERNTYSIAEFPYVVRSMVNSYGPNWRQDRDALSSFRDTITREMNRNINNAQVMRDYQTARPRLAERYVRNNPNWMDTIEGRRDLRTRARRVGVQFGGSSNEYDESFATSQKDIHMVGESIISNLKNMIIYHLTETSIFIDRKKETNLINLSVFNLFAMLCPNIEIKPEVLLSKIRFSVDVGTREKNIVESVVRDFKADLSDTDIEFLDNKVRDLTGKEDQTLDTVFPTQEKFLGDLLGYWSGSRRMSNNTYKFFYRSRMRLFEAHTCFNQLITGDMENTKDFLERFLISHLMSGTTFGIAGRRKTMKKKRKSTPQVFKKFKGHKVSLEQKKPSLKTMSKVIGRTQKLYNKHKKPIRIKKKKSKQL